MPIRLSEIANVVDDVENQLGANYYKNEKSIGLAVYKQSNGNTIKIVDAIYDQLPRYRAQIPPSVKMELFADRSVSVRNSVKDVQVTLAIAIVLVVAVIFLFLRGRRHHHCVARGADLRSLQAARRCTHSTSRSTT
jgi:HAE1 family hydrophobic/amphiphilic exporter-1